MDKNEKHIRVKYMRLLEKFVKSSSNTLKLEDFNYKLFEKRVFNSYSKIEKMGDVKTDSSYMNSLRNFIDKTVKTLRREDIDSEKKREILLKESNLVEKSQNRKSRKKEKHKTDYLSQY